MADVAVGNRPIWPMGGGWKNHMFDPKKLQKSAGNTKRCSKCKCSYKIQKGMQNSKSIGF